MSILPQHQEPVMLERHFMTMDEAAATLGVSRRTLTSLIGRHPHYVQGGKKW